MIETVQERQKGAYNFESYYENLCALQDTCPIPAVKAHLPNGILDINSDRIRQNDWTPIFNSIKINKSLRFLGIRSYFHLDISNGTPEKKAKIMRSRIPVIRTKEMLAQLSKVIRDCLITTDHLECLELQGIHLKETDMGVIGQGLMKNSTLRHLSLEGCRVGDPGLSVLCSALKMAGNVSTLNLTSCSLSASGIYALGDLIKFQAMSRHNEAWKESLRYRWANFDSMCGIRRMTLNGNVVIGDEGAAALAESLKDDLWVKAIDMQECGLGNAAVRAFLSVLKYNSTLVVLDFRNNPKIDKDLLRSVTEKVLINGNGRETEYKWLRIEDLRKSRDENYERHPRTFYNGPSRPLDSSNRPVFKPGGGRLRSKSACSLDRGNPNIICVDGGTSDDQASRINSQRSVSSRYNGHSRIQSARDLNGRSKSRGQPWRTAARANRYKGYPPDHVPGKSNLEEHYEVEKEFPEVIESTNHQPDQNGPSGHRENKKMLPKRTDNEESTTNVEDDPSSVVSPLLRQTSKHPPFTDNIKKLKAELFHVRSQLDKLQKEKSEVSSKLKEVCNENERLRNTIKLMSKTNAIISEKTQKSTILQDEAILRTIDSSFKQFNAFLDMLRQSGLGKVVSAAGMDNFASNQHQQLLDRITFSSSQQPSYTGKVASGDFNRDSDLISNDLNGVDSNYTMQQNDQLQQPELQQHQHQRFAGGDSGQVLEMEKEWQQDQQPPPVAQRKKANRKGMNTAAPSGDGTDETVGARHFDLQLWESPIFNGFNEHQTCSTDMSQNIKDRTDDQQLLTAVGWKEEPVVAPRHTTSKKSKQQGLEYDTEPRNKPDSVFRLSEDPIDQTMSNAKSVTLPMTTDDDSNEYKPDFEDDDDNDDDGYSQSQAVVVATTTTATTSNVNIDAADFNDREMEETENSNTSSLATQSPVTKAVVSESVEDPSKPFPYGGPMSIGNTEFSGVGNYFHKQQASIDAAEEISLDDIDEDYNF